ncbi:MAG: SulP family inorganic anion transporter [Pyrinomonadaceae bacterium]
MNTRAEAGLFSNVGADLAAGLVVFFVALPLCLGIALASGAPLFSGLIAGVVGGIVVGFLSKSHLSVSGPAAGLTAIVLAAVTDLGAFNLFLCAVLIAGVLQLALGFLKAGTIANYLPSNVIEGMLAGIGVIIILKQLPHAVGFDKDAAGNFSFLDTSGGNTFASLARALDFFTPGAVVIAIVAILIMKVWEKVPALKRIKVLPGALVAVVCGVVLNDLFVAAGSGLAVGQEHLVTLPVSGSAGEFLAQFNLPDVAGFTNQKVWTYGLTIAVVASVETLLCIEAVDTLDPHKRYTPPNHELKAQGVGNILNGLLGGLPITSVIVRSSANLNAGARTKLSSVAHGVLLLVCAATIPFLLNKIPLAVLAAILILTGYKLANPALVRRWFGHGWHQFVPFAVTVVGVVLTDLLVGVALGLVVSVAFILRQNQKSAYFFRREKYQEGDIIHIHLAQEVTFLNKAAIKLTLEHLPPGGYVIIDASETVYIDHDVSELIREFDRVKAPERGIRLELVGFRERYNIANTLDGRHVEIEHTDTPDAPRRPEARLRHGRLIEDLTRERLGQEGA